MRAIETTDVSRPRESTTQKAAAIAGDVALAVLLVLALPLGLMVLFSPLAALVRFALALTGLV